MRGNDCTGLTARWCPNHGDCGCPADPFDDRYLSADGCPLHDDQSTHPEAPAGLVVFS